MGKLTKKARIIPTLLCCGVLGWSTVALGAFDTLESELTGGAMPVQLEVAPLMYIEDPGTIDFNTVSALPGGDLVRFSDFCVYTNDSASEYEVRVYSSQQGKAGANSFGLLGSSSGHTIDYAVQWTDGAGVASTVVNDSATFLTAQTGGLTIVCDRGDTSRITLTIAQDEFNSAEEDTDYLDSLTIEVQQAV